MLNGVVFRDRSAGGERRRSKCLEAFPKRCCSGISGKISRNAEETEREAFLALADYLRAPNRLKRPEALAERFAVTVRHHPNRENLDALAGRRAPAGLGGVGVPVASTRPLDPAATAFAALHFPTRPREGWPLILLWRLVGKFAMNNCGSLPVSSETLQSRPLDNGPGGACCPTLPRVTGSRELLARTSQNGRFHVKFHTACPQIALSHPRQESGAPPSGEAARLVFETAAGLESLYVDWQPRSRASVKPLAPNFQKSWIEGPSRNARWKDSTHDDRRAVATSARQILPGPRCPLAARAHAKAWRWPG